MTDESMNQGWFQRKGLALLTDFYQLTMMAGQWKEGRAEKRVSFEYFFRNLPPHTGFAVTAGLDLILDYLANLHFMPDDIAYLRTQGLFEEDFLEFLADFKPAYDIHAMPEGSIAFPYEPIVQVDGTIMEAQLVETALLNMLNYSTLIATKSARICQAACNDPVMEFGLRRAHGPDGGISGSRAAYIGGCTSTSNVLAGKIYGIPVAGTHAHSWVMSFSSELEAFRAFARHYPDRCTLLVDTYDTVKSGVPNAITVFKEMKDAGHKIRPAIRLDSGDLAKLSKIAYNMMIDAGLENPLIVASNDLEEDLIADLKRQGSRINAWGVGTHLITSKDSPSLSGVYKLAAIYNESSWQPRMKITSNVEKATDPGKKKLVRYYDSKDHPLGDVMYLHDENWDYSEQVVGRNRTSPGHKHALEGVARAESMLKLVIQSGQRLTAPENIQTIRDRAQQQIAYLPEEFKRMRNPEIYDVLLSPKIGDMKETMLDNPELA